MKLFNSSLTLRLLLRLILLSVVSMTIYSIAIYTTSANHLKERKLNQIEAKTHLLLHILTEARSANTDIKELKHRLDDYFSNNSELALKLTEENSNLFYATTRALSADPTRVLKFSLPSTAYTDGTLTASLSLESQDDKELLDHLKITLLLGTFLCVLGISVGGFWQTRSGLLPLNRLVAQTKQLNAPNLINGFDGSEQPQELRPLVDQINLLLNRLDSSYRQMESFNADVAHELNSPLATLIMRTELILSDNEQSPVLLRDALGLNLEELQHIAEIIRDMLFLAHADRGEKVCGIYVDSLANIAAGVIAYHEAALTEAQLKLEILGDSSAIVDAGLLKRSLSNLISNATQYAARHSTVHIEITPLDDMHLRIAVTNQGVTVAPAHQSQIFDRFFRASPSRNQDGRRHGLGLAIVAAIARMHDGQPFASFDADKVSIGMELPTRAGFGDVALNDVLK